MKAESYAADFWRDGFVVVEGFVDADRLARLRDAVGEVLTRVTTDAESAGFIDFFPPGEDGVSRPRKVKSVARLHSAFDELRRDKALVDIVASLLGDSLYCGRNKIEMKPAGLGRAFEWHQDWAYSPYTNDGLLHAAIPLDDMSPGNGGLRMIPGSHRGDLLDHHRDGVFVGAARPPEALLARAVDLVAPAGSLILFHCRTVHSSPPNQSHRDRRLVLMEYARGDAWPLLGVKDWEAFAQSFVRGSPTVEPLVTDVPRRLPFPGLRGKSSKL